MAPRKIDTSKWDDEEYNEYEDIAGRFSNIRVSTEPADEDEPGCDDYPNSDSDSDEDSDEDSSDESASETESDCDSEPASPASSSSGEFTEAVAWHLPRDRPLPRIPPWTGLKYLDKRIKKEWQRREAFEKEDRALYREFLREQREREEQRWRASRPQPERRDSSGSESPESGCHFCADGTCYDCSGRHSDEEYEEEGDGEEWDDQNGEGVDDGEGGDEEEGDDDGYVGEDEDEEVSGYEG